MFLPEWDNPKIGTRKDINMSSELIYEKKYPNPWEDSDFFTAPDEEGPLHGIPQEPSKFLPRELIEK